MTRKQRAKARFVEASMTVAVCFERLRLTLGQREKLGEALADALTAQAAAMVTWLETERRKQDRKSGGSVPRKIARCGRCGVFGHNRRTCTSER